MTEYIEGTHIPRFSERGMVILVLRSIAPNRTSSELKASGLFEVRWACSTDTSINGNKLILYRKSDGLACSSPMCSEEAAWQSAEEIMQGNPGYYQPPYFCSKAGKLVWETWERLHVALYRNS